MKVFDWIIDFMEKFELSGVTLISKGLAIAMPLPVAYQTMKHAMVHLEYTVEWAWIIAIIVECFGYAAIYKTLQFAEHNRRYTDPKNKAPFWMGIAVYLAYLVIVIVFNVVPEMATGKEPYKIAMNIALALLNIPGGVLMGISAIFTERKAAMKRTSGTTSETRLSKPLLKVTSRTPASRTTSGTAPQPMGFQNSTPSETTFKTGRPSIHQDRVFGYMDQVYRDENRVASFAEVERDLELPQSTASRLRNSWVDKMQNGKV